MKTEQSARAIKLLWQDNNVYGDKVHATFFGRENFYFSPFEW